jgi:hypothetical protein
MKKIKSKIIPLIFLCAILATVTINPLNSALTNASISTKDQLLQTIDTSFSNYLASHNVVLSKTFPTMQLNDFLHQNPEYVNKIGEYLNLTEQQNFAEFKKEMPNIAGTTVACEGPIYATTTMPINGTPVDVNLRNITLSNGVNITKITFCTTGVDPNVYVMRIQNTLPFFGVNLPCGFSDYVGIYIAPSEANAFKSDINNWADNNDKITSIEQGLFNLCLGVSIPDNKVVSIGLGLVGLVEGYFTGTGFDAVRDAIDSSSSYNQYFGINWCLENTYQYYPDSNYNEVTIGYQNYWVRNWDMQNYPFVEVQGVTETFLYEISDASVANAMVVDDAVNTFGVTWGWNTWTQVAYDQMPKILDPAQPITVSVVGIDDVTGINPYYESQTMIPVYIDGNCVGYLGYAAVVTASIQPGEHTIQVGDSYNYNYNWDDLTYYYATFDRFDYIGSTDTSNPSTFTALNDMSIIVHFDGNNLGYM